MRRRSLPERAAKRAAPLMAMLLLSVAPEVNTISLRVGADQRGDLAARVLDRGLGLAAHDVLDAVRVAVVLGEPGQHRRDHARVAAGGRLVVQIDRAVRAGGRAGHARRMWVQAARGASAARSRAAMRW